MRKAIAKFLVNSDKERAIAVIKKHNALTNASLLSFSVELNIQVLPSPSTIHQILQLFVSFHIRFQQGVDFGLISSPLGLEPLQHITINP
ncbi:MAG: hypothetical protein RLZZ04_2504 [Cyanobacteriota bacterium]